VNDLKWREGPLLPENVNLLSSAQLEDGFLAIGGRDDGFSVDTVYKFSQDSYEWSLREERLNIPRQLAFSVPVPDSFLNC